MMKCSKAKGFILVETMVVIAFLATTLLTVYSAFTTVLDNAKTRIFYDDPIYLYRTYYFLSFLERNNLTDFIDTKFANTSGTDNRTLSIVEFGCNALSITEASGGASESGFCESLKSSMDINHVFFMHYDVNEVIACDEQGGSLADKTLYCQRNKALQNLSISAVNYLYTLDGYTGSSTPEAVKASGYRIVMEFRKAKTKTYQYFDYNKSTTNKETMQETTYNYYYTTLRVPYGYDIRNDIIDGLEAPIIRKTFANDHYAYKNANYAEKIKTITLVDHLTDAEGAVAKWDYGVNPGTVQAYIKNSTTYNGYYDLYIEGNGHLYANQDSSYFLNGLSKVEQINDLTLLDTTYTTNMSYMFGSSGYSPSTSLKSLDLSNFNTARVTNMKGMFAGTTSLTSLNLETFDTRYVTDMSYMFYRSGYLSSLDLSNFNTSKVTDMSYMFGFAHLVNLDLRVFDTSNVTDMSGMFQWNKQLTNLNISSFNTSKVKNMFRMFMGSDKLTSLNLANFDTTSVTDMSEMFYFATSLSYLNVSSFNTSNVTNMRAMFASVENLTTLNLSNFDTHNVTNMAAMFSGSFKLTYLNVSSFNTSKVTGMHMMFRGLRLLTSLNVSNFDTRNVQDMTGMFAECSSLKILDLANFNTSNVRYMGNVSMYFYYRNNQTFIEASNYDGMFEGCTSLTALNLSNFDTSKVIYMGGMFANCSSLVSLDISNFNTQAVQYMEGMFYGTSNLTNYSLPNFEVKSVTTAEAMFAGSKINTVKMNMSSFNSKANLKYFVNNNGQVMNLTVRTNQDKALFTKLNLSKLTVNVSTN